MPKDFSRTERLSEQLRRELADLISRDVKDPRVDGMVSLTEVRVSKDLAHAHAYFTKLGGSSSVEDVEEALNRAAGFLRHTLGKRLNIRTIPQLHFRHDDVVVKGAELETLIDQAVAKDRSRGEDSD